jgi:hypothetical protein
VASYIHCKSGSGWFTDLSPSDARQAIAMGNEIDVWWFAAWGTKYEEKLSISEDEIAYIRTEGEV